MDEEMKVLSMYFTEDELVVSPTRSLKRLSQVAENMEIITAEEIERMNAHTLAEIFERVTGMFFAHFGNDFGSDGTLTIHGSTNKHILVLLDGIIWNTMSDGNFITNTVPVRIIERIEIIKGPASSSWGSSLGGVINIVTKKGVNNSGTGGAVSVSGGERDTYDFTAELSSDAGPAGYYLYAGRQEVDGLRNNRYFDNDTFYSKINIPFSPDTVFMFTGGYNEHHINSGDLVSSDIRGDSVSNTMFTTASFRTELSRNLTFDTSFHYFVQKFLQNTDELGTGVWGGNEGDLFKDTILNEKTSGASGKLVMSHNDHVAVIGVDYSYGTLDQIINVGQLYQSWASPATITANSSITKWAVFLNDSVTFGKFSVTPGVRHDYNSIMGSTTSPSIGATYRAARNTILRSSIAKGFNVPSLSSLSGGALFLDPNPDLTHEKIISYQAGIESWAVGYMKVKFNMFHHNITNSLVKKKFVGPAPAFNDKYFNQGEIKSDGFEIQIETAPFHDISLETGYTFVHKRDYSTASTSTDTYSYIIALRYDDRKSLYAQLEGRYVWWDQSAGLQTYDVFICDLNMNRKLYANENFSSKLFFTAHNILNGSYYTDADKKNPSRWVEAGLRVTF